MKIAGAVLIIASFAAYGAIRAAELRYRARLLSALCSALELMRSEITARLTPVPEVAALLSECGPVETRDFFALLRRCLDRLGELEFAEIWLDCARSLPLRDEELSALSDLGGSLGRYGAAEQGAAISRCMERLGEYARRAGAEANSGGRLCTGLGLTAGALLAVLLI